VEHTQHNRRADLIEWRRFLRAEAHVFRQDPGLIFQQAVNSPAISAPARAADHRARLGLETRPWLRRLNRLSKWSTRRFTLAGPGDQIRACACSPDNSMMASGALDGFLRIWDADTGQGLAAHHLGSAVTNCMFLPDGERVLCGAYRGPGVHEASIIDARTGDCLTRLSPTEGRLRPDVLALSADGRQVAAGVAPLQSNAVGDDLGDRSICLRLSLFDTASGQETIRLEGHTSRITACAFSPDGAFVASMSDYDLKIWNVANGGEIANAGDFPRFERAGHPFVTWRAVPIALTFSKDGRLLLTYHTDGTLRQWEAATLQPAGVVRLEIGYEILGHDAVMISATHSRVIIVARAIAVLDSVTGKKVASVGDPGDRSTCVSLSADGSLIVTGSVDGSLRAWGVDDAPERVRATHTGSVTACSFSPDGRLLLSGAANGWVQVWDAVLGRELMEIDAQDWVQELTFTPDGRRLLAHRLGRPPIIWEVGTAQPPITLERFGDFLKVRCVVLDCDGALVVTHAADGELRVWRTGSDEYLAACCWDTAQYQDDGASSLRTCRILDGGSALAAVTAGQAAGQGRSLMRTWNLRTGETISALVSPPGDWSFSPTAPLAISFGESGATLWDWRRGCRLRSWEERAVTSCAFSPLGTRIVLGFEDGRLVMWGADEPAVLREFAGHKGPVRSCQFSPNGRRMVSSSDARPILILWDVDGAEALHTRAEAGGLARAAFSSDGSLVLMSCKSAGQSHIVEAESGQHLKWYPHAGRASCWGPSDLTLAVGERAEVHLLRLENFVRHGRKSEPEPWNLERDGLPFRSAEPEARGRPSPIEVPPEPVAESSKLEVSRPRSWWRRFFA
jgi:WD40 repeat protein